MRKKGRFEAGRSAHTAPQREPASREYTPKQSSAPRERAKKHGLSGGVKALIVVLCVALLGVLGVCAYGYSIENKNTIFPNVYIAGVNVGGMTQEEAKAAVEKSVADSYKTDTLTVTLPDRTLSFDPSVTHIALNSDEAVADAMRYGRSGGPIGAVLAYRGAKTNEYTVNLQSSLNLDTDYIRKTIDDTAAAVKKELTQPQVTVDESAGTITVVTGSPAQTLDADKLYETVIQRFTDSNFSELKFSYDTTPCDAVDLQSYYDKYGKEMKDAYYDETTHKLVSEVKGYGFDVESYTQQLALAEPGTTVVIQMKDMDPQVTLEQLKKEYFSDTLAKFSSAYVYNSNRTNNLILACKAINGTILNPGEEFSFNNVVGERTAAKGYLAAIVYQTGGVSTPELGGGVCQVASTIYYATLLADLKVTDRAPHMYVVSYVDAGLDATVYWGSQDYKFVNSTDHPLRIDASAGNGYVNIALVGTKQTHDWTSIKLTSKQISTNQWKVKNQNGVYLTVNGKIATDAQGNKYNVGAITESPHTGSTWMAYRHFLDANGKELSVETLGKSTYISHDEIIQTTPYVEPEPTEPTEPTTPTEPVDPSVTPGEGGTTTDPGTGTTGGDTTNPWG
jgi:vancomycin resistance protein YoaR